MTGSIHFAIRDAGNPRAMVMIHGFHGNAYDTFGMLPAFLAGDPSLSGWDIHCLGYPTSLAPDITGVWAADPDLTTLASHLDTFLSSGPLAGYDRLALVAHSMGGLIVQRAVLDGKFTPRLSHVLLFGTPSNGLRKAGLGRLFKRQARDMVHGGPFITTLRQHWEARFSSEVPFQFRATAGIRDQFVPPESSVLPFPSEYRWYVGGNHLEMVKPENSAVDTAVLLRQMFSATCTPPPPSGSAGPSPGPPATAHPSPVQPPPSPHDAYRKTVDNLWPKKGALTGAQAVSLALALEMTGRQEDAVGLLEQVYAQSTELMGVLAGRLKRRWLADPEVRHDDGLRALELYRQAFEKAHKSADHPQAFYNGINTAFMKLALDRDRYEAWQAALTVLDHCRKSPRDKWRLATEGEAYLYLGDVKAALVCYETALTEGPDPREVDSMRQQAVWAARLMDSEVAERGLATLFGVQSP